VRSRYASAHGLKVGKNGHWIGPPAHNRWPRPGQGAMVRLVGGEHHRQIARVEAAVCQLVEVRSVSLCDHSSPRARRRLPGPTEGPGLANACRSRFPAVDDAIPADGTPISLPRAGKRQLLHGNLSVVLPPGQSNHRTLPGARPTVIAGDRSQSAIFSRFQAVARRISISHVFFHPEPEISSRCAIS